MKKSVLKYKKMLKRATKGAQHFLYKKPEKNIQISEQDIKNQEIEKEKQQLENAEQTVTNQKSKKKKYLNFIFLILNIVVVAGILTYQLTNETITSFDDIKNVRAYIIPIILLVTALSIFLDAYRTNIFVKKSGNRSRPFLSYKMCAIGKYYDNITPMSAGGEPSQIFYMSHRGLDASSAISIPMARYVVSQISWMIMGVFAVVMIAVLGIMDVSVVLIVGILGFAANFLLTSLSLLLSLNKRLGNSLVVKILKFLQKIHVIKHYDKCYEKVNGVVGNYQSTMQTYAKNKMLFLYTIFISLLIFILNYTMPFLIYLLLGGTNYSLWFDMMIISVIIELASSIIPLPGGTGMNEISFTVVFGTMFPEGTVFWGLLIWRFMTYYWYIIQGLGITIYDYFIGNRKFNWLQKKWQLEEESINFKEEQIKNYKKQQKRKKKNNTKSTSI